MFNYYRFAVQHQLGQFASFRRLDWVRVQRLIFICHGNICRSPLGEYVARAGGATAESFGLQCGEQFPADPRAAAFGASTGLDLSAHRSRNISSYIPSTNDLLVVMEPAHLHGAMDAAANIAQVTLAGLWSRSPHPYIHDPFSANAFFFERCEATVADAAAQIARRVVKEVRAV